MRTGAQRQADHREARAIGDAVGEEIEGVRLQGLRPGEVAGEHLDDEHRRVDDDHNDQPAAVVGGQAVEGKIVAVVAAHRTSPRAANIGPLDRPIKVTTSHPAK